MKKPKICLGIESMKESLDNPQFEGYELKAKSGGLQFNILKVLELKQRFEKTDLSLHSQLSRTFSCTQRGCPEFNDAELDLLKAEITTSKIIGIKQITFHMKEGFLTEEEKKKFRKILDFAKKKGVEMIYESNSFCEAKNTLRFLEDFQDVNYCLDFGHINTALVSGKFGMGLMEFIDKIKSRTVNVHAHNNDGDEDTHKCLNDGSFPWKKVLDKLKNQNLNKIIIECKSKDKKKEIILESKRLLEEYYSQGV
jgi:sugar phosphate isomerase/epimerase